MSPQKSAVLGALAVALLSLAGCSVLQQELEEIQQISSGSRPDGAALRDGEVDAEDEADAAQAFLLRNRGAYAPSEATEGEGPRAKSSFILEDDDGGMMGSEISISGAEIDMSEAAAAPARGQLRRPRPAERAPVLSFDEDSGSTDGEAYVDIAEVEAAIGSRAREFTTYCLDFAGFRNESLQQQSGIMRLDLTLAESGRLSRVALAENSDVTDEMLHACLDESFRRMQLPRPRGGAVTFSYPIRIER